MNVPNALRLTLLSLALALWAGCATFTQPLQSGETTLGAEGTVHAVTGANGNTQLTLKVKHLAPASKVSPGATGYIVWVQPRGGPPQNVGSMKLSENLEGSMETTTPHHRFTVLVTAEPGPQASQPTTAPVFTSEVERTE
jgi:hypothetical protein